VPGCQNELVLRSLDLNNYRSWAHSGCIELAPLTGFFGTNSSGKSSLLRFLLMLKQTAESRDRGIQLELGGRGGYVDLGSMTDVLFDHDVRRKLSWSVCWDGHRWAVESPTPSFKAALDSNPICFSATHSLRGKASSCEAMSYSVGGYRYGLESDASGKYQMIHEGFGLTRPQGRPYAIGAPVKTYAFPDNARLSFTDADFLQGFELSFERTMADIHYLGPLREDPQRQYTWSGGQPSGVGRRGELVVDALLAARERGLKVRNGPRSLVMLERYVATWLQKLDLVHAFKVDEVRAGTSIYQILVQQSPKAAWVPLTDVGFGVSQVLPVLVLCFSAPEGSTLILEQPEIHLHPKVQAGLADVFIDAIRTNKIQIIVESHSEHFLQRLMRRVAEETVDPRDTAMYFCDNPNGGSQIRRLEVDIFGNIRNWPQGFFGDPLSESLATAEAANKHRARTAA
jgi:predicted ATPase